MRVLRPVAVAILWNALVAGCQAIPSAGLVARSHALATQDARVRADLGIPEAAPSPRLIFLDGSALARLDADLRELLRSSGGGLYDRKTQTIYIDGTRYREGSVYHELVHHYFPFLSEKQREECLARLYEVLASQHSSFNGCAQ